MYIQLLLNSIDPEIDVTSLETRIRTALRDPVWRSLDKSLRAEDELTFHLYLSLPCTGADIEHHNAGHALLEVGVTQYLYPLDLLRLQNFIPCSITHLRDVHHPSALFASRSHPCFISKDCHEPVTTHSAERTKFVLSRKKLSECGPHSFDGSPLGQAVHGQQSINTVDQHSMHRADLDSTANPHSIPIPSGHSRNKRPRYSS
jgi:hypothetical protein